MIEVRTLRYCYPKAAEAAVRGISFDVSTGEIFGFLGPSGAGKSTTQRVLTGLLRGYGGSVRVMGKELRERGADYFETVGVSFELPNHFLKLSGLENLAYFRSLYSGDTEAPEGLLERLGLTDAAHLLVARYSKGMQMRLSFARALLNKPRLLFLDEPTSGLDPANAKVVKDLILEKRTTGTTVFLTTHNMSAADELCDRVAFIADGEIKAVGAPKTLKLEHAERTVRVEYGEGSSASRDFSLDGLGQNADFLRLLRQETVQTIHSQEVTLETVFLRVTGQGLA
ncbi:ABC transporter ATP-binding protein [soil metagenome]|jgi:fluoroquinolone transport system ATP-binding protein|nr:ABC transporter ATP-binding protein [Deinococcota bacterium]